jgi:hypothetical protein
MNNITDIKNQGHISVLFLQGGNPGRGFVSGLTSSLTASTVQNLGGVKIATAIGGALSGGVGAAVVGGNFYEGAVFGLMVSSLNHLMHDVVNSKSVKYSTENAKKVYKEIFGEIPNCTDIIADGTAPSSYTKDGITVSDGVVFKDGVEIYATGYTDDLGDGSSNIYLFRAAFTSRNQLINTLGHEMFHANLLFAGINGAARHHASISIWQISLNDRYPTFTNFGNSSMKGHLILKSLGYFNESDLIYAPVFKK